MKNRNSKLRRRGLKPRRPGFALVVALTAIVLITVIVLAFFSKALLNRQISFTSTNQIKSDMLARTAVDIVVGEVRQEIVDFSAPPTNGIFLPKTQQNLLPVRTGVSGADTNVGAFTIAKVGAADTKIDPGTNGRIFGSTITLDQQSRNGRTLSQWFKAGPSLGSADLPSWTYLSRSGSTITNVTPAEKNPGSESYVTGRFSYTVYNVGGLLDANVAGYPSSIITNAVDFGARSSIAYADLTALGLSTNQIENLINWRNAATATTNTIFNTWATGIDSTNTAASKAAALAATSGYLETAPGDNTFFSRRDLLRYLSARATSNAAPHLTHFTRSLTAPTWKPANVSGSTIKYGDNADSNSSVNRGLLGVPGFDGVVTDYNDDGTSVEREVWASEPLIQRKFSLAKLAWLGHDGPNITAFAPSLNAAQRADAIKTCFGLTWRSSSGGNSSDARWIYDHGDPNNILTLDEVRKANRAPDFFELLKAGILRGSLAGHPGEIAKDVGGSAAVDWSGPIGRDYETYSARGDQHVLQIGANIIDQADANNYPTAIYLNNSNKSVYSVSQNNFHNTVFGVENLPVLSRMGLINAMMAQVHKHTPYETDPAKNPTGAWPDQSEDTKDGPMGVWFQPEVWNPHERSTAGSSPTDPKYPTPSTLRLVVYGNCYVWNVLEDPDQGGLSNPINFGNDFTNPIQNGIICFKNPGPTSTSPTPFFDAPVAITGGEQAGNSVNYTDTTVVSGTANKYPSGATWTGGSKFLAVFLGEVYRDPRDKYSTNKSGSSGPWGSPTGSPQYNVRAIPDPYLTAVLEYYDGNSWRPYSTIGRMETLHNNGGGSGSRHGSAGWRSYDGHIDPRTDRFSGSAGRIGAGNNSGWDKNIAVRGSASTAVALSGGLGKAPIFQAWPRTTAGFFHNPATSTFTSSASTTSNAGSAYLFDDWAVNIPDTAGTPRGFWYADPDGAVRPGDAWRANFAAGDGVMTYHGSQLISSAQRRRPVILNRPFRSVGELGYVYRDQPFKTLDLWSAESPDAGLLDLFEVSDRRYAMAAGQINPSVATPKALAALLSGAGNQATTNGTISPLAASTLSQSIAGELTTNGPLTNTANLVSRLSLPLYNTLTNSSTNSIYQNKSYGEAPLRALSSVTSTRTWNLLVDVVAQSGKLSANASGLGDFIVEGERRYWLTVAVDRFTGEIIDQQLEPAAE